jgi:hypothetical protein
VIVERPEKTPKSQWKKNNAMTASRRLRHWGANRASPAIVARSARTPRDVLGPRPTARPGAVDLTGRIARQGSDVLPAPWRGLRRGPARDAGRTSAAPDHRDPLCRGRL